ncbi:hypothetical protein DOTSEDRAFT_91758 [Dothistroma septosporum NZE10]|uniref:Major facilitator superfamily (MFS) profile domain-containing protein n=1 Tax=Dothistroma septosporum (strain NZE10 / CBS 128990) TaxID=675120 RepID=M2YK98_DOTSN|nr:hypothetical protein DOTSEDRAFT_91758 [Dothistroma septosporum NZE10]
MQSLRQYRAIKSAVTRQVATGKVVNVSNEKISVLDNQASSDSITTTSLDEKEDSQEPIIVGWEGPDDPLNPRNWPIPRRCLIFAILWINVFAVDWASSADSQAGSRIASAFHVSEEAEALSPSLYTFGLALGSLFAGPTSETAGRNPVYVISRCFHVAWLIGAALAPDFGAQCVFRFLAGLSGSILLAIHAASVADIFGPVHRTLAWPIIALASFWGTAFSPIAGAWIAQTGVDWRWADWIAVILSGSTLVLTLLFLPETFSPILLSWRAKHLREVTGNQRFRAELESQHTVLKRFKVALLRALHMVTREPIVVLLGAWLVLEYIVVFGLLQGMSYILGDTYGFSRGLIGTSFAAIGVGCALWSAFVPWYYHLYKRKVGRLHEGLVGRQSNNLVRKANIPGSDLPDPEYRLWSALLAAPAFPIALFWLGWTNYTSISPWSSLGAVVLLGFSWAGIYVTVYQYLLDTYGIYAGSALAIITCWRYLASGAVNLVSRPMYDGIGVHWVMTLLGCLAVLQMPLPIVFYYYGPRIRQKSAFAGRYARPENARNRTGRALQWR